MSTTKRRPVTIHPLDAEGTEPVRVLILLRQSDSRGAGERSLSLDSQDTILQQHAERPNWRIVDVLREPDIKGWYEVEDRPGLSEAIRRARAREFDVILVYTIDRLFRSVRIQEQVLFDLEKLGVRLVSVTEPYVGEPLYRQLVGAIAEQQTRTISGHVRRAFAERARRGLHHGVPPYGYQPGEPKGPPAIDPDTGPIAAEIMTRFAGGDGPVRIAEDLTNRGIPSPTGLSIWRVQTVMATIRNPAYAGYVRVNGELHEGQHPALIDRATWQAIEARLALRRRNPRRKTVSSWLEGLVQHECGNRAYLMPPAPPGTPSPYFRCKARSHKELGECLVPKASIRVQVIDQAVRRCLANDLATLRTDDAVIAAIREEHRRVAPLADRRRRELAERRKRAESGRLRIEDLYISGARDRAWFDAQEAQIAAELAACDAAVGALPQPLDVPALRTVRRELVTIQTAILHAAPDDARRMLAAVGVVVYGPGGIHVAYHPAIASMLGQESIP